MKYKCRQCGYEGFMPIERPEDMSMRCSQCRAVLAGLKIRLKDRFRPTTKSGVCENCAELELHEIDEFPCSHCTQNDGHI